VLGFLEKEQHCRSLIWHLFGLLVTIVVTIYTVVTRPKWIRSAVLHFIPWKILWFLNLLMVLFNIVFIRYFDGKPLSKCGRALHHLLNIIHLCTSPRWIYMVYAISFWLTSRPIWYTIITQMIRLFILDAPVLIFNLVYAANVTASKPNWALGCFMAFIAPQAICMEVYNFIKYSINRILWVTVRWYPGVNRLEGVREEFPWDLLRSSLWAVVKQIGRQVMESGEYAVEV
jgi:hypothetical protein